MMASSWRRGEDHGQGCAASPPRDAATARQRRSAARNTYEAYVHRKEKRAMASEDTPKATMALHVMGDGSRERFLLIVVGLVAVAVAAV